MLLISGQFLWRTVTCLEAIMSVFLRYIAIIPLRIWFAGTIMPITGMHIWRRIL